MRGGECDPGNDCVTRETPVMRMRMITMMMMTRMMMMVFFQTHGSLRRVKRSLLEGRVQESDSNSSPNYDNNVDDDVVYVIL